MRDLLEDFLAPSEKVVQSFLEMRSRLSKLAPDLSDVFLVALLDLLLEELLQRAVA